MSGSRGTPNRGALFTNDRKETDRHPDWTGVLELDADMLRYIATELKAGRDGKVRLGAWKAKAASGMTYISIQVSKPQPKPSAPTNDLDDDIPF